MKLAALLLLASTALAQEPLRFSRPKDFIQLCGTQSRFDQSFCSGYIIGIVESMPNRGAQGTCPRSTDPKAITILTLINFEHFIDENPGWSSVPTALVMEKVLKSGFPCGDF